MKRFSTLAVYCGKAYSIHGKWSQNDGGGHAVHERQAILSTTVVISYGEVYKQAKTDGSQRDTVEEYKKHSKKFKDSLQFPKKKLWKVKWIMHI